MLEMSASRVIAAFNELESTYGPDHVLVKKILQRFIDLQINDSRVPNLGGKEAHEVLCFWSNAIHDEFHDNNNRRLVSNNSGMNTALATMSAQIHHLSKRQDSMDQRMSELVAGQELLSNAAALAEENA